MNPLPASMAQDEERLGGLAMKFRGTRRDAERPDIAKDYSQTVDRLIQSGKWHEMPPPEDQLPDDWMPPEFFEYWSRQRGTPSWPCYEELQQIHGTGSANHLLPEAVPSGKAADRLLQDRACRSSGSRRRCPTGKSGSTG